MAIYNTKAIYLLRKWVSEKSLAEARKSSVIPSCALDSQTPSKEVLSRVSVQTSQRTSTYFLQKLRDKHPEKRHRRVEAHNISKLCEKYPGKYPAPSEFYFGEIDSIFSASKDAEIDLAVLRVESEVAQEDFDRKQKERKQEKPVTPQSPAYQSPLVRRDNEDDDW